MNGFAETVSQSTQKLHQKPLAFHLLALWSWASEFSLFPHVK